MGTTQLPPAEIPPAEGPPAGRPPATPPGKRWNWPTWAKVLTITIAALFLLGIVGVVVGGGNSSPPTTAKPSTSASQSAKPKAVTPPGLPGSAVGSSFTVTDVNGSTYGVRLVKVLDPPKADPATTPDAGMRFVAAVFEITPGSGQAKDNGNLTAVLVGSNGQTYEADFNSIVGYTNFDYGDFAVSPGHPALTGAVLFQVPTGVKVAGVRWSTDYSGGYPVQTWSMSATSAPVHQAPAPTPAPSRPAPTPAPSRPAPSSPAHLTYSVSQIENGLIGSKTDNGKTCTAAHVVAGTPADNGTTETADLNVTLSDGTTWRYHITIKDGSGDFTATPEYQIS